MLKKRWVIWWTWCRRRNIYIYIYDEDKLLGRILGWLLPDKAGFLIISFYGHNLSLKEKEEVLKEAVNYIFDVNKMQGDPYLLTNNT